MELSIRVLAEYLAMTRTRNGKHAVKTKAKVGKCLRCDCDAVPGKRGLCKLHYNQFDYDRECQARGLTGVRAINAMRRFDEQEVEAGNVLGARRGRKRVAS